MSKFWLLLICISIIASLLNGSVKAVNEAILNVAEDTFAFVLPFILLTSFYNGILYVARDCGLLGKLEMLLHPLLRKLLPDIKEDKQTLGYVSGNIVANMFGLGSAATPMGLKAIEGMQKHNPDKERATRSMVTFLVLNTGGVTIISTTIIALRSAYGSLEPTSFVIFAIISTFVASIVGLIVDRVVNYRD
ncbi:MAG: spore maturation protein A [Erysipelotrichia bacterium]|nr:spore maturation protein A [Erysipelotrichia bacterium]